VAGKEVFVACSIGIALSRAGAETSDDVLRNADTAMYHAKAWGKGCYSVYEPSMHATALARLELEADLQKALQRSEFVMHYQPIVHLDTGRIVAVEALLRWYHPNSGVLGPKEFLASLEETGLIVPVGRWALRQACQQLHWWHVATPGATELDLCINVSGREFRQSDLTFDVVEAVTDAALDPAHLIIEVTEGDLMQDTKSTIARLSALRDLGVKVAIDDFGTGYSSLSYLQQFPVDMLKIDRSFIAVMSEDQASSALADTIIGLGKAFNLRLVAEGIELDNQLQQLLDGGCHLGQGFLFSQPRTAEEITELLRLAASNPRWWQHPLPAPVQAWPLRQSA
jgi:EAL domain-containing protein (putative c-di-GMP-specific phosphodiesterase class I)